jgi:hypothetical protein
MPGVRPPSFDTRTLDDLTIDDEPSFKHVGLYADLKGVLKRDRYTFRVLPKSQVGRWDRALCLNLTFWGSDAGGDILVDSTIPADVVAHVAWHHLAAKALASDAGEKASAHALFLGESIASAFDVYLVGRLLGHAPSSSFLETQVPSMADAAAEAGASDDAFETMLSDIAKDPDAAFDDLQSLLFRVACRLVTCASAEEALVVFDSVDDHRFAPILHRFELSNWVLYARAYASHALGPDARVAAIDDAMHGRAQGKGGALGWITRHWLTR